MSYISIDLDEDQVTMIVDALDRFRDGDNETDLFIDDIIAAFGELPE